jgi:hypothetical protein
MRRENDLLQLRRRHDHPHLARLQLNNASGTKLKLADRLRLFVRAVELGRVKANGVAVLQPLHMVATPKAIILLTQRHSLCQSWITTVHCILLLSKYANRLACRSSVTIWLDLLDIQSARNSSQGFCLSLHHRPPDTRRDTWITAVVAPAPILSASLKPRWSARPPPVAHPRLPHPHHRLRRNGQQLKRWPKEQKNECCRSCSHVKQNTVATANSCRHSTQ